MKLPALMAAVSPEQTGVELMHQLAGSTGQVSAPRQQLLPEVLGRGLERQRAKGVAHLPQQ
jgi:hypothetical protein